MPQRDAIYLDWNAAAPLHPKVSDALRGLLEPERLSSSEASLFNPSSSHRFGRHARALLLEARSRIALSLDAPLESVVLTSSGTESNQLALHWGLDARLRAGNPLWLRSQVEHDSVTLDQRQADYGLPVDSNGALDLVALQASIQALKGTALVSLIWAHNETGVIQDVNAICQTVGERRSQVWIHCDAAQAWGKIPISARSLFSQGVDLISLSGHKIGALAGTGVLLVSPRVLEALKKHPDIALIQGSQEQGLRGGTENVLGAFSLGVAAEAVGESLEIQAELLRSRQQLESALLERVPSCTLVAASANRVSGTTLCLFKGARDGFVVDSLALEDIAISKGSACRAGLAEASPSLIAMGVDPVLARTASRFSFGKPLSCDQIERVVSTLERVLRI